MARKQVAKVEDTGTDMYSTDRPDYIENGNKGQENVGIDDLSIPRVSIVQSLSPQRKKNDPAYIEDAEEGMMFNNITSSLYGEKMMFVPVFFRKEWLIWKLQEAGGGFKGSFPNEKAAKAEWDKEGYGDETFKDDNKNVVCAYEIVDTAQQFGMVVHASSTIDNPVVDEVVISMSKSQMKPNRALNTMIKMNGGDRFSRIYEVKAVEVDGTKGTYFNYSIRALGFVTESLYELAGKLYDAVSSGNRDVNRDTDSTSKEKEKETEY